MRVQLFKLDFFLYKSHRTTAHRTSQRATIVFSKTKSEPFFSIIILYYIIKCPIKLISIIGIMCDEVAFPADRRDLVLV